MHRIGSQKSKCLQQFNNSTIHQLHIIATSESGHRGEVGELSLNLDLSLDLSLDLNLSAKSKSLFSRTHLE